MKNTPTTEEVLALRNKVSKALNVGIIQAIDICASAAHVSRRTWQRWETGTIVHPAHWELVEYKLRTGIPRSLPND